MMSAVWKFNKRKIVFLLLLGSLLRASFAYASNLEAGTAEIDESDREIAEQRRDAALQEVGSLRLWLFADSSMPDQMLEKIAKDIRWLRPISATAVFKGLPLINQEGRMVPDRQAVSRVARPFVAAGVGFLIDPVLIRNMREQIESVAGKKLSADAPSLIVSIDGIGAEAVIGTGDLRWGLGYLLSHASSGEFASALQNQLSETGKLSAIRGAYP
jgi:hypothetical protein